MHQSCPSSSGVDWWTDGWLDRVLDQRRTAARRCLRPLARPVPLGARDQATQTAVITDASRSQDHKNEAKRLRREAEAQLELLTATSGPSYQSDFYSYRYLASEGFLPGYNFPRLPLSAYIPGRAHPA